MRIATKIISGYGILIALMAALLAYEVSAIHRMQSINRNLSALNFKAALTSLQLRRNADLVDEWAKKYFATGDPDFGARLAESRESFESSLRDIRNTSVSEKEQTEIQRLALFWMEFNEDLSREQDGLMPDRPADFPPVLENHLERLGTQTQTVYEATLKAVEAEVEKSRRTGERAETISWTVAAIALVLSLLVSFLIVRSISVPLSHLTEGTRAIAEGHFYYRLDTSRTDEFSQLAKDFNTMTERLNELDEMKKDFVSHVSHELKAPLASMQETVQLMLEEVPGPLTDKQKRLLQLNLQSSRRLSSMIGTLLDLSRMEAGVMEYELKGNDLAVLVRTAVDQIEHLVLEKELRLELDLPEEPLLIECDEDRILQVLSNLLGNAVKFSPKNGEIGIRLSATAEAPPEVPDAWRSGMAPLADGAQFALLRISDSGPGIPDPDKVKIFEKFHQVVRGRKTSGQGVGLGLAISRTIVEAHRGAIWVQNRAEGGSLFCVLLPPGEGKNTITYRSSSPL